ncbi:MAG: long-chain fatty acid--CoA ligase, partial [Anaerolineales bacterium]
MHRYLLSHGLDEWAQRTPDEPAVVVGEESISFRVLRTRAEELAACLLKDGVHRGDRVGIYLNKCIESVISVYGILKAGAAYVPLDPFAPVSRLRFVIENCGIQVVISEASKMDALQSLAADCESLSKVIGIPKASVSGAACVPWEQVFNAGPLSELPSEVTEQDLAYILYTSGSTGTPKGIMHTHRSGLSFAEWAADNYGLLPSDRVSNHAPLHFDLSTFDIFASHIAGATVILIPEAITKFPASLSKLMQEQAITVWY